MLYLIAYLIWKIDFSSFTSSLHNISPVNLDLDEIVQQDQPPIINDKEYKTQQHQIFAKILNLTGDIHPLVGETVGC